MIVTEEIARVHSSLRVAVNMQVGPALALLDFGSEDLKKRYLKKIVDAELLSCFAITEPDTGSDVASMRTRAVRDGDGYVLNGSKTWISNAHVADVGLVYAYTDPEQKHRGMSAFMVERGMKGFTTGSIHGKLGVRAGNTGFISMQDVRVPKENMLGKESPVFRVNRNSSVLAILSSYLTRNHT